jgi:hypothetical protein
MPGVVSTSSAAELGRVAETPSTVAVEGAGGVFARAFADIIGADLQWANPADVGGGEPESVTRADRTGAATAVGAGTGE